MQASVVSYILDDLDRYERTVFYLMVQCAPLLKGIRHSCMISIERTYCRNFVQLVEGTGILNRVLTVQKDRCMVLLYKEEPLTRYLDSEDVRKFLSRYGYDSPGYDSLGSGGSESDGPGYGGPGMEEMLGRLSARMCRYAADGDGFPHEVGIFLGYPIADVEGFIQSGGRNCLLGGYWKVYAEPTRARMSFLAYDKARVSVVNELLAGKTVSEIVISEIAGCRKLL